VIIKRGQIISLRSHLGIKDSSVSLNDQFIRWLSANRSKDRMTKNLNIKKIYSRNYLSFRYQYERLLPVIGESRRISCKDKLFSFVAGSLSSDKNEKKKNTNAEQGSAHKKVFGKFYGERAA